jgi:protoporphyrinogen oxidase
MTTKKKKLIVVGGGITGLSLAYIASKSSEYDITLVEAGKNFGGLLNTFPVGDELLEFFYHHFFTHDAELNWIIKDMGIEDHLFYKETNMGIFRDGGFYNFSGIIDLFKFKPIGFIDKFRWGLSSLYLGKFAKWDKYENTSTLDWFYKWAGKRATEAIWKPLLDIKFGPYSGQVPLTWMIGRLRQRMNSRKAGVEQLGYLSGSLKVLLDAILDHLTKAGVQLVSEAPVTELIIENNQVKGVKTDKGTFMGDQVVLTIPSPPAVKLLKPHHEALANKVGEIKYFGAVCTILELDRKLSDIYWLNVSDEGYPFGGIIEHTNFIPPEHYEGRHIVYLSRYFAPEEPIAKMDSEEIKALMIPPLKKIYKDFDEKWIQKVHVFKTMTAAPVCDLGFSKKIVDVDLPIDGLYLVNMTHLYPDERGVNNSIRLATETCRIMGIPSDFVPKGFAMVGEFGFDKK